MLDMDPGGGLAKYSRSASFMHDQRQSRLFQLPLEIRLLIYEHAFGRHIIHWTTRNIPFNDRALFKNLLRHVCEQDDLADRPHHSCKSLSDLPYASNLAKILPAFVLTCRRVHFEVLTVLYTTSIFDVRGFTFFPSLLQIVPRSRLQQVRKLWLTSRKKGSKVIDNPAWEDFTAEVWEQIKGMTDLRELRFKLWYPSETKFSWKMDEADLLDPLKTLAAHTRLKRVEVAVTLEDVRWSSEYEIGQGYYKLISEKVFWVNACLNKRYA